jgi:hypothetical protein
MTETEEYDKAFADMAAEPLDIDEQQRADEIRRLTATRQSRRNARLKAAANHAGFETIDGLAAAITDGSAVVVAARPRRDPS